MQAKFSSILFVAVFVASSIDSVATESKATPRLRHQDDKTARYLTTAPRTGTASNEERGPFDFIKNLFARSEKLNVEPRWTGLKRWRVLRVGQRLLWSKRAFRSGLSSCSFCRYFDLAGLTMECIYLAISDVTECQTF